MSNPQIEKLKNSINKKYLQDFDLSLMQTSGFIPVDRKANDLYVIISKSAITKKQNIEEILKKTYSDVAFKFIPIEKEAFTEVYNSVTPNPQEDNIEQKVLHSTPTQNDNNASDNEISPEQMLVSIGWLTQSQLNECLNSSRDKKIPLDSVFMDTGYLSYERIVSYLKKK